MSICPHCHQMDKNFFAPVCHNCNNEVGFFEQCVHSLVYTVVYVGTTFGLMWLIFLLLFG